MSFVRPSCTKSFDSESRVERGSSKIQRIQPHSSNTDSLLPSGKFGLPLAEGPRVSLFQRSDEIAGIGDPGSFDRLHLRSMVDSESNVVLKITTNNGLSRVKESGQTD